MAKTAAVTAQLGWVVAALMLSWHMFSPASTQWEKTNERLQTCLAQQAQLLAAQSQPQARSVPPPPCPACDPCPKADCPKAVCPRVDTAPAASSNAARSSTIATFREDFNALCRVLKDDIALSQAEVATVPYFVCLAHLAQFDSDYDYSWDKGSAVMGYYRGYPGQPRQMALEQYLAIMSVIDAIPPKTVRLKMREQGASFADAAGYYKPEPSDETKQNRGTEGPNVLFIGCGSDVPMWTALLNFLGGHITFVDNNAEWATKCTDLGAKDLQIVEYNRTAKEHGELLKGMPDTGEGAAEGAATADEFERAEAMTWPRSIIEAADPYDVIVVDGPWQSLGRSLPLYGARRIAESYHPNHYTHIFLHDAARGDEVMFANKIMGHDPKYYFGSTLPRKGLKHWRIPGKNRPYAGKPTAQ